ncbi:hypothetical protein [Neopusillimonas aromaticivorans]|uniref:hypothetical protein n=1 Tax=Neopusillimonas aromaticivorans TaxID=2979868 RepID=UPI002595FB89|nr:hypothetical protein [Neopusillimonas aromaticivorans]WJJ93874.1 hypothetical protein N7E01_01055 [Neopusillimonas aromaticivorans]
MNETLDLFRGRALKIARQYDTDHMTFADLTGMADDYAAAFHEALGNSLTKSANRQPHDSRKGCSRTATPRAIAPKSVKPCSSWLQA